MSAPASYEQIGTGREAVREMKDEANERAWRGDSQFQISKSDDVVNEFEKFKK